MTRRRLTIAPILLLTAAADDATDHE